MQALSQLGRNARKMKKHENRTYKGGSSDLVFNEKLYVNIKRKLVKIFIHESDSRRPVALTLLDRREKTPATVAAYCTACTCY